MRKFFFRVLSFATITAAVLLAALLLTTWAARSLVRSDGILELPDSCRSVMFGDSHTAHAFDDGIIPGLRNFSQAADCYLYSYVKIREFIRRNPQLDTVLLGYTYHSLAENQDRWLRQNETVTVKLNRYGFMMTAGDILPIMRINLRPVVTAAPMIIKTNGRVIFQHLRGRLSLNHFTIGGFDSLRRYKLQESLRVLESFPDNTDEYSKLQKRYLLKIRDLCEQNGIRLILIKSPIHPALENKTTLWKTEYYRFHREEMPGITLLDYGAFTVPDSCYGDVHHLNHWGSDIFSEYIRNHGMINEKWVVRPEND